ncbi:MAG: hypothetical protein KBT28_03040 [Bacteroidales bacterium]|nr:hypothetical protein [Candidatus Colimorpha merdihippi]
MALILGTEYCKMDSSGRFKLPNALKKQLETTDCRFVVRHGFTNECLELWTYDSFQNEVARLRKELNPYRIQDQQILRQLTRANIIEMDNSDRLMIPPERKSLLGDAKELVLQSTGECIEIWERNAYDKMNNEIIDLASIVDNRLGAKHELSSTSDAE